MRLLFIFGTRPEAIKMAPLVQQFKSEANFTTKVCLTGQHREMLDQVLQFFKLKVDYNLALMKPNQDLYDVTIGALQGIKAVLDQEQPDLIFVQGDTTSAFVGALAGYYEKIKVAHIEAGLRSHDIYSPFPEEGNRALIGRLAHYHFAPTRLAVKNLNSEGVIKNIHQVGNTGIDALTKALSIINLDANINFEDTFSQIDFTKKIILITAHRRENFGAPLKNLFHAFKEIAETHQDVQFLYPVHLNPNVRKYVHEILENIPNFHLIEPLPYPQLVWMMSKSYLIITDSGGIQEEAPSLGKPVLVTREVTERIEGIEAGTALLVGTNKEKVVAATNRLLQDKAFYESMAQAINPYGDGKSSERIIEIIKNQVH